MFRESKKVYCAFCKIPRRAYLKKHISLVNFVLSFLVATVIMQLVWGTIEPKALVVFVFLLAAAEIFIQIRWRLSVRCPHCNFDPVLYLRDREQLVKNVKIRLSEVEASPSYLIARANPLRTLPHKKISDEELDRLAQKNRIGSRSKLTSAAEELVPLEKRAGDVEPVVL